MRDREEDDRRWMADDTNTRNMKPPTCKVRRFYVSLRENIRFVSKENGKYTSLKNVMKPLVGSAHRAIIV